MLHFSRDHSIRKPQPELTEKFGAKNSPNACNACHEDKTATWAREHKEKWWGKAPRRIVDNTAQVVALRTKPGDVKAAALVATLKDTGNRVFFRLTALNHLGGRLDRESRAGVRLALSMPNVEILQRACEIVGEHPDPAAAGALLKLIGHETRTVRLEAAYALARSGWRGKTPELERAYQDALAMLPRQEHFIGMLERIAMIADVIDDAEGFTKRFDEIPPPGDLEGRRVAAQAWST